MRNDKYLFIDGGHLQKYYRENVQPWFGGPGEIDFNNVRSYFGAYKCFYYDCVDNTKHQNESESDFQARIKEQEINLNKIRRATGTHVRLGSLTGSGREKRQKEVDVLLAVDMMTHAVRGNMREVFLLSGDRDFKPVVESLVQMGLFVEVAGDIKHTSKDLACAADNYLELKFQDYYRYSTNHLQSAYPIGYVTGLYASPEQIELLKRGAFNGGSFDRNSVTLYHVQGSKEFYLDATQNNGDKLTFNFGDLDLDRLGMYFKLQYESIIQWE